MATIEGTATEFSHRETLKEDFDGIKAGIHDSLSSSKDLIKDLVFAIKAQWFTKEVPIEPEIIVTTNYCEQNLPKNTDLGFFTADRLFFSSKFATLP